MADATQTQQRTGAQSSVDSFFDDLYQGGNTTASQGAVTSRITSTNLSSAGRQVTARTKIRSNDYFGKDNISDTAAKTTEGLKEATKRHKAPDGMNRNRKAIQATMQANIEGAKATNTGGLFMKAGSFLGTPAGAILGAAAGVALAGPILAAGAAAMLGAVGISATVTAASGAVATAGWVSGLAGFAGGAIGLVGGAKAGGSAGRQLGAGLSSVFQPVKFGIARGEHINNKKIEIDQQMNEYVGENLELAILYNAEAGSMIDIAANVFELAKDFQMSSDLKNAFALGLAKNGLSLQDAKVRHDSKGLNDYKNMWNGLTDEFRLAETNRIIKENGLNQTSQPQQQPPNSHPNSLADKLADKSQENPQTDRERDPNRPPVDTNLVDRFKGMLISEMNENDQQYESDDHGTKAMFYNVLSKMLGAHEKFNFEGVDDQKFQFDRLGYNENKPIDFTDDQYKPFFEVMQSVWDGMRSGYGDSKGLPLKEASFINSDGTVNAATVKDMRNDSFHREIGQFVEQQVKYLEDKKSMSRVDSRREISQTMTSKENDTENTALKKLYVETNRINDNKATDEATFRTLREKRKELESLLPEKSVQPRTQEEIKSALSFKIDSFNKSFDAGSIVSKEEKAATAEEITDLLDQYEKVTGTEYIRELSIDESRAVYQANRRINTISRQKEEDNITASLDDSSSNRYDTAMAAMKYVSKYGESEFKSNFSEKQQAAIKEQWDEKIGENIDMYQYAKSWNPDFKPSPQADNFTLPIDSKKIEVDDIPYSVMDVFEKQEARASY